jgi:hypothetical protein
MKITSITCSARRQFNHPHESFANFNFSFEATAQLFDHDDPLACLKALQDQLEDAAEQHKADILKAVKMDRYRDELKRNLQWIKGRAKAGDPWAEDAENETLFLAELAKLIAARAKLPFAPKQIHPGHPDHADTDDSDDGYPL